jgi:hypothetical protein
LRNPEQFFGAGYSACFIGAIKFVATRDKIAMPADASMDGSVGIGPIPNGFGIEVEMKLVRLERRRNLVIIHLPVARRPSCEHGTPRSPGYKVSQRRCWLLRASRNAYG